jgi:release factor glutamine methyltransferase
MKPIVSLKQGLKPNKDSSGSLLKQIQDQLSTHSESPYLDSLVILGHISGNSKSELIAHPSPELTIKQTQDLTKIIEQLQKGIPLPYLLGEWEFYQLKFNITPDVLIPRPETEGLVDLALNWLESHPEQHICLEIGTGSGCIAISLAKTIPDLQIIATDISQAALEVARNNAASHGVLEQIQFLELDMLTGFNQQVDLLVANLPYIPTGKLKTLAVYQSEPTIALDGGQDGLHYIKKVLKKAGQHINPGGAIFLELDEDCGTAALDLAKEVWPGITLHLSQDLSGQDRYLSIQF